MFRHPMFRHSKIRSFQYPDPAGFVYCVTFNERDVAQAVRVQMRTFALLHKYYDDLHLAEL